MEMEEGCAGRASRWCQAQVRVGTLPVVCVTRVQARRCFTAEGGRSCGAAGGLKCACGSDDFVRRHLAGRSIRRAGAWRAQSMQTGSQAAP